MTPVTGAVRARIEALFPPEEWTKAERLLAEGCGRNLPLAGDASDESFDRVRIAVLKLSNGSLQRLEEAIEGATIDWRDTLVTAGFGDDVLAHRDWMPEGRDGGGGG